MADKIKSIIKLFFFIQKNNLKIAFLNKSDALINVIMMTINNLSFIFMWWIIFQNKQSINGWIFDDMAILFSVLNTAFAFYAVFTRGVISLPEYIENGNLDNFLTTPQNSLFLISTSESTFANWGDLITGLLMFFLSSYANLTNFLIIMLCSIMIFILYYSFSLLMSSLSFFIDDFKRLGENIFTSLLTFASQPASIFSGWHKVIFLTILPAGVISLYPVRLIQNFNLVDLGLMFISILFFFVLSIFTYHKGLKHYASGNRFGVR